MTNLTETPAHCVFGEAVEAACRRFDMCLADRLAAAAEAGEAQLLRELLDVVDWIDSSRYAAAVGSRLN